MDMVERVARALCDDTLSRWRSPIAVQAEPWREFIPAARAVIAAMREPTQEMLTATHGINVCEWRGIERSNWECMIDAALGGNTDAA